jgi:hypothetical protein
MGPYLGRSPGHQSGQFGLSRPMSAGRTVGVATGLLAAGLGSGGFGAGFPGARSPRRRRGRLRGRAAIGVIVARRRGGRSAVTGRGRSCGRRAPRSVHHGRCRGKARGHRPPNLATRAGQEPLLPRSAWPPRARSSRPARGRVGPVVPQALSWTRHAGSTRCDRWKVGQVRRHLSRATPADSRSCTEIVVARSDMSTARSSGVGGRASRTIRSTESADPGGPEGQEPRGRSHHGLHALVLDSSRGQGKRRPRRFRPARRVDGENGQARLGEDAGVGDRCGRVALRTGVETAGAVIEDHPERPDVGNLAQPMLEVSVICPATCNEASPPRCRSW